MFGHMDVLINCIIFGLSLIVLVKSSDYFTDVSEKVGVFFGIPQFIIGITIVSAGTSIPELVTSFIAAFNKTTEFVSANAYGSNVTNILLVAGVCAIISKGLNISSELKKIDVPLFVFSALITVIMAYDGVFNFVEALICVLLYVLYIFNISMKHIGKKSLSEKFSYKWMVVFFLSIVGIYFGAKYTVSSVIELTNLFGFSDTSPITITVVALGTSLPELSVSLVSALKKNFEMSVGNIIGSNIFNVFMVIGLPGLFLNLNVSSATFYVGVPFMLLATALMTIASIKKKVSVFEGFLYLLLYALFIYKIFF